MSQINLRALPHHGEREPLPQHLIRSKQAAWLWQPLKNGCQGSRRLPHRGRNHREPNPFEMLQTSWHMPAVGNQCNSGDALSSKQPVRSDRIFATVAGISLLPLQAHAKGISRYSGGHCRFGFSVRAAAPADSASEHDRYACRSGELNCVPESVQGRRRKLGNPIGEIGLYAPTHHHDGLHMRTLENSWAGHGVRRQEQRIQPQTHRDAAQ